MVYPETLFQVWRSYARLLSILVVPPGLHNCTSRLLKTRLLLRVEDCSTWQQEHKCTGEGHNPAECILNTLGFMT